jgi:PAS domain S-box-containing protein
MSQSSLGTRKRMPDALATSEARLHALLEAAVDGIVSIDEQGIVQLVNPAAERLFGYSAHELIGQSISVLMPSPYREGHDQFLARYLATGEKKIIGTVREVLGRKKDGTTFPFDLSVAEARLGSWRVFVGFVRDIAERHRAHNTLQLLAARLLQAQEEERRRIARELHDDWTQRLAALAIDAAKLEKQLDRPDEAVRLVRAMRDDLITLSEGVHALSRQLHPSIIEDLGLIEALRSECAGFTQREGIAVAYRPGNIAGAVPKDVALCLYRVAQEALRNIAKHAATNEAWVELYTTGRELVLCVRDRGAGFDRAGLRFQSRLGLASMEERVRLIQGKLSVESIPGRGTAVTVQVPLERSEA